MVSPIIANKRNKKAGFHMFHARLAGYIATAIAIMGIISTHWEEAAITADELTPAHLVYVVIVFVFPTLEAILQKLFPESAAPPSS